MVDCTKAATPLFILTLGCGFVLMGFILLLPLQAKAE